MPSLPLSFHPDLVVHLACLQFLRVMFPVEADQRGLVQGVGRHGALRKTRRWCVAAAPGGVAHAGCSSERMPYGVISAGGACVARRSPSHAVKFSCGSGSVIQERSGSGISSASRTVSQPSARLKNLVLPVLLVHWRRRCFSYSMARARVERTSLAQY